MASVVDLSFFKTGNDVSKGTVSKHPSCGHYMAEVGEGHLQPLPLLLTMLLAVCLVKKCGLQTAHVLLSLQQCQLES